MKSHSPRHMPVINTSLSNHYSFKKYVFLPLPEMTKFLNKSQGRQKPLDLFFFFFFNLSFQSTAIEKIHQLGKEKIKFLNTRGVIFTCYRCRT